MTVCEVGRARPRLRNTDTRIYRTPDPLLSAHGTRRAGAFRSDPLKVYSLLFMDIL